MTGKIPNIILIVVDALRTRNLGCYGYSKPTSPNIDDLANEGILFEDAYSCNVVTDSSLTTIFSGRYPVSHGILRHGQRVRKEEIRKLNQSGTRFLSEILKSRGYATLAVDWLGRWHTRGFDYYSGMLNKAKPVRFPIKRIDVQLQGILRGYARLKKSTMIDEACLVTCTANNLIRKWRKRNFFLFVHYWDTHRPYAPPTNFYKNIGECARARMGRVLKRVVNLPSRTWRERPWRIGEFI